MSNTGPPPPPPPSYPPPSYGSQAGPTGAPPPNYLVWAILSTIFCCLPLGIVSIVFAAQVDGKWRMGDVAGANESSRKAKQFAIFAAIASLVQVVPFLILVAAR